MPASVLAENITYDGTQLQPDPFNSAHLSLYPTAGSSLNGNIIIVNNGTIPGSVYGGVSITGGTVNANTVILNGGTVAYNVYGGYSDISTISADDSKASTSGVSNAATTADATANTVNVVADNNLIFLSDSLIISGDLYGGYVALNLQAGTATSGTATNNSSSYASASAYASADGVSVSADNNNVALDDGITISGNLSGGYAVLNVNGGISTGGAATSNSSSATAYANTNAYTYANNANVCANYNGVILGADATVFGNFHGGYAVLSANGGTAISGKAKVNNVSSSGLANATANATADKASVSADNNNVYAGDNLSISGNLYGGYAVLNQLTNTATGGTAEGGSTSSSANAYVVAYANANQASVSADNNSIDIGDGLSLSGDLYGGYAALNLKTGTAKGGTATGNTSASGIVNAYAIANASADNASVSADSNSITLNSGNVGGSFYGGYGALNLQTGIVEGGTATNNTSSSAYAYAYANANVYTKASSVSADNNSVTLGCSVAISGNLYGGYAALNLQAGTATGGNVINSTSSLATANANANVDASAASVSANNNSVSLGNGGIVSGDLYGGYAALSANGGTVTAGTVNGNSASATAAVNVSNTAISANDNCVVINGGAITGNLYGGYVLFEVTTNDTANLSGSSVTATNNTITIGADTVLNAATSLYGGYLKYNSGYNPTNYDIYTGNTLNVASKHTIDGIYNFEYLGFMLPVGFSVGDSLITANTVNLDEYGSGSGSTVTGIDSMSVLSVGNTYSLITASGGFTGSIANTETSGVYNTAFLSGTYEWENIGIINNALTATLKSMSTPVVNPKASAVGEGFAAGLAFLGQAADLRSGLRFSEGPGFTPFLSMTYGSQYISTGSNIKVKGFSALTGLALTNDLSNGDRLTMGLFFEGGWGDYNSRNSFSNFSAVKGKGDTEYYGGGLMASYATSGGLYSEGSFAVGKTETDFRSRDFTPGIRAKYDFEVPYYSANLTVGQVLRLTDLLDLDVYGKYLWTRQEGDEVTILNDRFKFKDADSHRLRAGGKLTADVSPQLQPYAGAAFEYEFSGKIKGNLYGINLDEPSLRGGTGIGELGLVWNPSKPGSMKVDLGIQGYAGKREGVSGGMTVTLSF